MTWLKRLALIVALWATGIGMHLSTEQMAEVVVMAIKSFHR